MRKCAVAWTLSMEMFQYCGNSKDESLHFTSIHIKNVTKSPLWCITTLHCTIVIIFVTDLCWNSSSYNCGIFKNPQIASSECFELFSFLDCLKPDNPFMCLHCLPFEWNILQCSSIVSYSWNGVSRNKINWT